MLNINWHKIKKKKTNSLQKKSLWTVWNTIVSVTHKGFILWKHWEFAVYFNSDRISPKVLKCKKHYKLITHYSGNGVETIVLTLPHGLCAIGWCLTPQMHKVLKCKCSEFLPSLKQRNHLVVLWSIFCIRFSCH